MALSRKRDVYDLDGLERALRETNESESESEAEAERPPEQPNSKIDLKDFMDTDHSYFVMMEIPIECMNEVKTECLEYMTGTCYDEQMGYWGVVERNRSKLILIEDDGKFAHIVGNDRITHPSAVCTYEEGSSMAVLCSEFVKRNFFIVLYSYPRMIELKISFQNRDSFLENECRGLARSVGGNLMTMQLKGPRGKAALRLFDMKGRQQTFPINGARTPSFMDAHNGRVIVTDLGTQKIFLFHLDDREWDDTKFSLLKMIWNEVQLPKSVSDGVDLPGFYYVSRPQFDNDGHVLIADASGHTIKFYNNNLEFRHRVTTNFAVPYISSWSINRSGKVLMIDLKGNDIKMAQLAVIEQQAPWVKPASFEQRSRFPNRRNQQKDFRPPPRRF